MGKFFHNKVNVVLWVVALGLCLLVIVYMVMAAQFLISVLQDARNENLIKNTEIVTFNLAKVQQLKQR